MTKCYCCSDPIPDAGEAVFSRPAILDPDIIESYFPEFVYTSVTCEDCAEDVCGVDINDLEEEPDWW